MGPLLVEETILLEDICRAGKIKLEGKYLAAYNEM